MARVTAQERSNIFKLVVGMFNAAPGAGYLQEFSEAFVAMNNDYNALALALGNTAPFKSLYPANMSAAAFANKFLGTLGLQSNQDAQYWVKMQVSAGKPYAQVMLEALVAIIETPDPAFADAQKLLENKATLAEYFSVTQNQASESMERLQSVFSKVTAQSDLSSAAAKEKIIQAGLGYKMELDGYTAVNLMNLEAGDSFVVGAYDYVKADWVNGMKSLQFQTASKQANASLNLIVKDQSTTVAAQNIGTAGFKTLNIKLNAQESGATYFSLNTSFNNTGGTIVQEPGKGSSYKSLVDIPANHWTKMALDTVVLTGGQGLVNGKLKESLTLKIAAVVDLVDASNFKAQLTVEVPAALTTTVTGVARYETGDTLVKVGEYGVRGMLMTAAKSVTTFQFTKDAISNADTTDDMLAWKVYNFGGIKDKGVTADTKTVLDLSALKIHSEADLSIVRKDGDVIIHGENGQNFKIVLVGQTLEGLGTENFVFG